MVFRHRKKDIRVYDSSFMQLSRDREVKTCFFSNLLLHLALCAQKLNTSSESLQALMIISTLLAFKVMECVYVACGD